MGCHAFNDLGIMLIVSIPPRSRNALPWPCNARVEFRALIHFTSSSQHDALSADLMPARAGLGIRMVSAITAAVGVAHSLFMPLHLSAQAPSVASRRLPARTPWRSCRRPYCCALSALIPSNYVLGLLVDRVLRLAQPVGVVYVLTSASLHISTAAAAAGCPLSPLRALLSARPVVWLRSAGFQLGALRLPCRRRVCRVKGDGWRWRRVPCSPAQYPAQSPCP